MPAFRWWEKDTGRAIVTNHPRDAAEIERRHSDGKGLLHDDGASRANILSGDAPHSMLTMSTVLDRDRPGRLGQDYFAYFASPYGVARTVLRAFGEVSHRALRGDPAGAPRRAAARSSAAGPTRSCARSATVIQLDLQVAAVTADVLAGRPVVYTTFLAYDEVAHHSGLERPDTLAVLRRVDRAIDTIADAVPHAPRPYKLVVLSDHGQSPGRDVPAALRRVAGGHRRAATARARSAPRTPAPTRAARRFNAGVAELASRDTATGHVIRTAAGDRLEDKPDDARSRTCSVMAVRQPRPDHVPARAGTGVTRSRSRTLRPGLIDALRTHPGIGFVLVDGAVLGPRRHARRAVEGEDPLAPFGATADTSPHRRASRTARTSSSTAATGRSWTRSRRSRSWSAHTAGSAAARRTRSCWRPPELPWPDERGDRRRSRPPHLPRLARRARPRGLQVERAAGRDRLDARAGAARALPRTPTAARSSSRA